MSKLILASKSPRRLALLREAGIEPIVTAFDTDETITEKLTPEETVVTLAERKAEAAKTYLGDDALILSADTVVALGDTIFGKPKDEQDADRILHLLSGSTHRVLTGVCVARGDVTVSAYDCTYIQFNELSDEDIAGYVATGEPMGKAGAYAVQENAGHFVKKMDGNYDNVVGLPVGLCADLIRAAFGLDLYNDFNGERKDCISE